MEHNEDYRCKDPKLRAIKKELRGMIKRGQSKKVINQWVMTKFTELGRIVDIWFVSLVFHLCCRV